jgi:hypothetical protein
MESDDGNGFKRSFADRQPFIPHGRIREPATNHWPD